MALSSVLAFLVACAFTSVSSTAAEPPRGALDAFESHEPEVAASPLRDESTQYAFEQVYANDVWGGSRGGLNAGRSAALARVQCLSQIQARSCSVPRWWFWTWEHLDGHEMDGTNPFGYS